MVSYSLTSLVGNWDWYGKPACAVFDDVRCLARHKANGVDVHGMAVVGNTVVHATRGITCQESRGLAVGDPDGRSGEDTDRRRFIGLDTSGSNRARNKQEVQSHAD